MQYSVCTANISKQPTLQYTGGNNGNDAWPSDDEGGGYGVPGRGLPGGARARGGGEGVAVERTAAVRS